MNDNKLINNKIKFITFKSINHHGYCDVRASMRDRRGMAEGTSSRLDLRKGLKDHFGYSEFKTVLQREAVECVLEGEKEREGRGERKDNK